MNLKTLIIVLTAAFVAACSNSGATIDQNANVALRPRPSEKPQTAIAHGPEMQKSDPSRPPMAKWSQGGDPVDTSKEDTAIMAAEKSVREKPSDAESKRALASAFFKRASILTEARQYASALGDYRRALKNDPSNAEAKEWIDRIVSIYASINKESPKEGEEPPPLPFDKTK